MDQEFIPSLILNMLKKNRQSTDQKNVAVHILYVIIYIKIIFTTNKVSFKRPRKKRRRNKDDK